MLENLLYNGIYAVFIIVAVVEITKWIKKNHFLAGITADSPLIYFSGWKNNINKTGQTKL